MAAKNVKWYNFVKQFCSYIPTPGPSNSTLIPVQEKRRPLTSTCTRIITVTLFIASKIWKESICWSTGDLINKSWQSHTRKCSSAQRRTNMLQHGWISDILDQMVKNTRQKCVYFIILFTWSAMTEIRTAVGWEVGAVFTGQSNSPGGWKAWYSFFRILYLFGCSTCDRPSLLRHAGSLVAACELVAAACGI